MTTLYLFWLSFFQLLLVYVTFAAKVESTTKGMKTRKKTGLRRIVDVDYKHKKNIDFHNSFAFKP